MDNKRASSIPPKTWNTEVLVGEHSNRRRRSVVRHFGAIRKEDVGISNDNAGRNLHTESPRVPDQR